MSRHLLAEGVRRRYREYGVARHAGASWAERFVSVALLEHR